MALNTIEAPYIVADVAFQGPGTGITGLLTSNFNYTAPFTGAVQRTVTSKLADVVSVMDFGADPTGTNDSTTAIQNAINAAQGSSLLVPSGTYLILGALLSLRRRLLTERIVLLRSACCFASEPTTVEACSVIHHTAVSDETTLLVLAM